MREEGDSKGKMPCSLCHADCKIDKQKLVLCDHCRAIMFNAFIKIKNEEVLALKDLFDVAEKKK